MLDSICAARLEDPGSSLFNQVVRNVPVLAPRHQALVGRGVRDISLASMTGIPHHEDKAEQARETRMLEATIDGVSEGLHQPQPDDNMAQEKKALVAAVVKKRKLYKQLSGTEVPWFPHDNDMALLKELCWESGRPRWVIHGTPASGAGVQGCLEAGCSVVLLCFDEHHRTHLSRFIMERAAESMVSGTTLVFKDESLRARSIELNLMRAESANKDDRKEGKTDAAVKDKKDKQVRKDDREDKDVESKKDKQSKDKQSKDTTPKKETPKKETLNKRKLKEDARNKTASVNKKTKTEPQHDLEMSEGDLETGASSDSRS